MIALAAMGAADTISVVVRVALVQLSTPDAMPAAALGGLGTIAIALLWMKLFPVLREVDQLE